MREPQADRTHKPTNTQQTSNMNTPPAPQLKPPALIIAVLASATLAMHAQSWVTVEAIFDLGSDSRITGLLVNPFPSQPWPPGLFLSAWTLDTGHSAVSLDTEQEPAVMGGIVDSFPLANRRLLRDGNKLLAAGDTLSNANSAWHVRSSDDGGETWVSLMHDWQLAVGIAANASGLALDAAGGIYVCGRAADARGRYHPVIRRGQDAGITWTTVLDGSKGANFDNVSDIQYVPGLPGKPGGIFAAGRIGNAWTVWRSRDGGATWPVVFSWTYGKNIAEARAIATDAQGSVYVGGMANRANGPRNWYVFASFDSGATWQDLGCPLLAGTDCILADLQVDTAGQQLWVVGSQGQFNWRMQRWTTAGWTEPIYPYLGRWSRATGVAVDDTTETYYVAGQIHDASGQSHGTVLEIR